MLGGSESRRVRVLLWALLCVLLLLLLLDGSAEEEADSAALPSDSWDDPKPAPGPDDDWDQEANGEPNNTKTVVFYHFCGDLNDGWPPVLKCAVRAAALASPDSQVFVYTYPEVPTLPALWEGPLKGRIETRLLEPELLFEGTLLNAWYVPIFARISLINPDMLARRPEFADAVRLAFLARFGGLALDSDMVRVTPVRWTEETNALLRLGDSAEALAPSPLAFAPKHPFLQSRMEQYSQNKAFFAHQSWDRRARLTAGAAAGFVEEAACDGRPCLTGPNATVDVHRLAAKAKGLGLAILPSSKISQLTFAELFNDQLAESSRKKFDAAGKADYIRVDVSELPVPNMPLKSFAGKGTVGKEIFEKLGCL